MLTQETENKIIELIEQLDILANKHNLRFDYFQYSFLIKFTFGNAVYFKVLYKQIRDKSIDEIVNTIYYSLHHSYRLIKEEQ